MAGHGLRRGVVRLQRDSADWHEEYLRIASFIRDAAMGLTVSVEHVGSTAVPGLLAKPVIDVAVGTTADELEAVIDGLRRTALVDRGDDRDEGGYLFVKVEPSDQEVRYAHIHVVERSSQQWHRYLTFRDRLRSDGSLQRAYEELKEALAAAYPLDRGLYTSGKSNFIRTVLDDA